MKQAGVLAVGLPFIGTLNSCKSEKKDSGSVVKATVEEAVKSGFTLDEFGIQLWSVRDFMNKDPKGTLKSLSDYGYNIIESFQGEQGVFWGMSPKEYNVFLSDHNFSNKEKSNS